MCKYISRSWQVTRRLDLTYLMELFGHTNKCSSFSVTYQKKLIHFLNFYPSEFSYVNIHVLRVAVYSLFI